MVIKHLLSGMILQVEESIYIFVGTHNRPTKLNETQTRTKHQLQQPIPRRFHPPKNGQETNHKEPNLKM